MPGIFRHTFLVGLTLVVTCNSYCAPDWLANVSSKVRAIEDLGSSASISARVDIQISDKGTTFSKDKMGKIGDENVYLGDPFYKSFLIGSEEKFGAVHNYKFDFFSIPLPDEKTTTPISRENIINDGRNFVKSVTDLQHENRTSRVTGTSASLGMPVDSEYYDAPLNHLANFTWDNDELCHRLELMINDTKWVSHPSPDGSMTLDVMYTWKGKTCSAYSFALDSQGRIVDYKKLSFSNPDLDPDQRVRFEKKLTYHGDSTVPVEITDEVSRNDTGNDRYVSVRDTITIAKYERLTSAANLMTPQQELKENPSVETFDSDANRALTSGEIAERMANASNVR